MLRSKPIGWITAGTLFCVAGVALACRLREGGTLPPEVAAAACSAAPGEKSAPVETTKKEKSAKKLKKDAPAPAPLPAGMVTGSTPPEMPTEADLLVAPPPSPVGVAVPLAPTPEPPALEKSTSPVQVPSPPVGDLKPVTHAEDSLPPVPNVAGGVVLAPPTPGQDECREPRTDLLKPEPLSQKDTIRPVESKEPPCGVTPAVLVPSPVPSDKSDSKKSDRKDAGTWAPGPPVPGGLVPPPVTMQMKEVTPTPPVAPAPRTEVPPLQSDRVPPPSPVQVTQPMPWVSPTPPGTPLYKVHGKGESLRDIAQRTLGNGDRWPEIYKLNPDLQPSLIVPSGREVRLPAEAQVLMEGPAGSQAEAEESPVPSPVAGVRPLPVVRRRVKEVAVKSVEPLTGTYTCLLQDRSLVLPKAVCAQIGKVGTVLLTPGPDRCLWLGTRASAARVLEGIEKSGVADREVQAFRRLYFSQSEKAVVSDAGKLTVPAKLAEYAGLGKEVVLIGIDDHFELWDAARWRRYSQQKEPVTKP
jgi:transcriptional regulator MraZ